ncbi:uncharacterized protein LOC110730065 [Chenopodium quinoa]|uniref:uncharacterized protein LOC110730065 n=1 Tax=Chenopodium quinoa TaxID=63459 RepID=UPI000B77655C|nr:uncharacterized protein LOC110730065 [Chenopodium quinoa]
MEQNHGLALADGDLFGDVERYRRLIGRLIYLVVTRPDFAYYVHILSQFMQSPRVEHWDAALRVVRYLKKSPGQGILLRSDSSLQLEGWCDSDWVSCPLSWRSLTGWFMFLGLSPVSWKTKKQPTIAMSFAEAEYKSMSACTLFHERTKHIEADCHFVRDAITDGLINPSYVPTTVQLADIFTKALGKVKFEFLLRKLGICDPYAPT